MGNDPDRGETYYERNVGTSSLTNEAQYDTVGSRVKERKVHKILDPKNSNRNCLEEKTPVVVASDFTFSRGKDIEIIDQKLPMLIGQIMIKNYIDKPTISFAGIGDAKYDLAPIQVGDFFHNDKLDQVLSHMWPEKGGGGNGQESYELMAYYYAYHSTLECNKHGKKGYFFFIGDEGFYDKVKAAEVKKIIGDDIPADLDTKQVFADLQEKYEVFFLFPQKSWEERKENIDQEIKKRVEQAGGLHDGVDIRASLIWNNTNDLDIHMETPDGFHIYYGNKNSPCGGSLDVDMNVRGETSKPVENIRWPKGRAKKGKHRVFVRMYGFHQSESKPTPFNVEVEINGQVQRFEKVMPPFKSGPSSDIEILTFDYNPEERLLENKNVYANYDNQLIINQWAQVIPSENILVIENPKAIVDVILGVLALSGGVDIENYIEDMKGRGQEKTRQTEVRNTLDRLATENVAIVETSIGLTTGRL